MIYKKKFDILTKFFPQIEKLLDINKIRSKVWQKFSFKNSLSLNNKFLEKRSSFSNKNPSKSSNKIPLLNNPKKKFSSFCTCPALILFCLTVFRRVRVEI